MRGIVTLKWIVTALTGLAAIGLSRWLWLGGWYQWQLQMSPPPLEPLPEYLTVYPPPGQAMRLSDPAANIIIVPDDPLNTAFNIPIPWQPGFVCIVLNAAALLEPGDFWTSNTIVQSATLALDNQASRFASQVTDGGYSNEIIVEAGSPTAHTVASTGGPYGLCWEGTRRLGRHAATFKFEEHTYSWWFDVER